MKTSIAFAAALLSLAPTAFANSSSAAKVDSIQYQYGVQLDVARVISLTDVSQQRGVVPVTMVYADSEGKVHKLQFLQTGGANSSG